ncbi:MAG: ABC transporter ATP-binding protein [Firmicutes bacterium]|nr:ABC transporter ATP-binding protein [Bacillota bacterium]
MSIAFKNFSKVFGDIVVFNNFSTEFEEGKISVIMGPSGAGKTTLLNAVAGLIDYEGAIEIDGKECEKRCSAQISYMFQEPRLIPQKTVFQNLDFSLSTAFKNKVERREKIEKMLEYVGLSDSLKLYPHELSGGMAQRVALLRAFLYPSKILLMDEPFKGLDEDMKKTIVETFKSLWQDEKRTTLFITHDIYEANDIGDVIFSFPNKPISSVLDKKYTKTTLK